MGPLLQELVGAVGMVNDERVGAQSREPFSARAVVVTGANSGVGFATCLALARAGAHVVMACRNMAKAEAARADLLAEVPTASVTLLELDVSEPKSIDAFSERLSSEVGAIDVLVNNAGVVGNPFSQNSAGYEMQLATNYLGPFALTGRLLPLFDLDAPGRIVNVGSLAHRFARLDLDDLNLEEPDYNAWKSYARSKLALTSFTMELQRRLTRIRSRVVTLAAHPGFAATEIGKNNPALDRESGIGAWMNRWIEPLIPTAEQAARSIIHAATSQDAGGGDYWGPRGFFEIGGRPGRARVNRAAYDTDLGERLWSVSERMTGVAYLTDDTSR